MKKSAIFTTLALVSGVTNAEEGAMGLDFRTTGYFVWDAGYLNEGVVHCSGCQLRAAWTTPVIQISSLTMRYMIRQAP